MSAEACSLKPCFACCEGQSSDHHDRRDSALDDTIIKAEHSSSIGVCNSEEDERLHQWQEEETPQVADPEVSLGPLEKDSPLALSPMEPVSDRHSLGPSGTESNTMSYLSVPPTSTTRRQSIVEVQGQTRRQSIVEVTRYRSRGSEGSSRPSSFLRDRDRSCTMRLRRLLATKWWQVTSLLVVFCALFLVDIYGLAQVPENTSLDIMVMGCFTFFVFELIANSIATEDYINSFFFWMDILGTASLIFDISFFLGLDATQPVRYGTEDSVGSETAVLARASRAAKQAARAGRMSRVLKLIRFLPFLRDKQQPHQVANAVSMKLTTMLATRVAFLSVCIVVAIPLFSTFTYPEEEHSMISWAILLSLDVQAQKAAPSPSRLSWINAEIARSTQFYQSLFYGPFGLCIKNQGIFDCSAGVLGVRFDSAFMEPRRKASIAEVEYGDVMLLFTLEAVRQYEAMANICLMFSVLLLMLLMCFLMNSSVNNVVLKPLQRVGTVLRQHCAEIMKITFEMPQYPEVKKSERQNSKEVSSNGEDKDQEVELLEKVLMKIVHIFEMVVPRKRRNSIDEEEALFLDNFAGAEQEDKMAAPIMELSRKDVREENMPGISAEMKKKLDKRSLNVFEVSEEQQRAIALYVMTNTRSCRRWVRKQGLKDTLTKFIVAVQSRYQANPFHSFAHGLDVVSELWVYLHSIKSYTILSEVTVFWLLVAALGHDLGHLGVNNQFLVETSHVLALRYNDKSVLESMHCALLFEVLSDASCNVLKVLEKADYKTARAGIVEVILGTDMVRHNEDIKGLSISYTMHQEAFQDAARGQPKPLSLALQEDSNARLKVLGALLHTADISNPMKPWDICEFLADRCLEEFFAQGDQEKELGIPVQMLNDREKVNRCTSQVGFIEFVIAPLAEQVVIVFPALNFLTGNLGQNIQTWTDVWISSNPPPEEVEKLRGRVQKVAARCGPYDAMERHQSVSSGVSEGLSDAG